MAAPARVGRWAARVSASFHEGRFELGGDVGLETLPVFVLGRLLPEPAALAVLLENQASPEIGIDLEFGEARAEIFDHPRLAAAQAVFEIGERQLDEQIAPRVAGVHEKTLRSAASTRRATPPRTHR